MDLFLFLGLLDPKDGQSHDGKNGNVFYSPIHHLHEWLILMVNVGIAYMDPMSFFCSFPEHLEFFGKWQEKNIRRFLTWS